MLFIPSKELKLQEYNSKTSKFLSENIFDVSFMSKSYNANFFKFGKYIKSEVSNLLNFPIFKAFQGMLVRMEPQSF